MGTLVRPDDNFLHSFSVHNIEFFSLENCGIFSYGANGINIIHDHEAMLAAVNIIPSEGLGFSLSSRENFEYFCSGFCVQIGARFSRCAKQISIRAKIWLCGPQKITLCRNSDVSSLFFPLKLSIFSREIWATIFAAWSSISFSSSSRHRSVRV